MNNMNVKTIFLSCSLLVGSFLFAQGRLQTGAVLPTRQVPVHDPVMTKANGTYYLFCTGMGIAVWSSADMNNWKKEPPVFSQPPQWAVDTIPGFKGHIWAPDIFFHKDKYYLYYSVSAFGKNTSAIGVATNTTLDRTAPDYKWVDHGRVIQSYPNKTNWNAIDPNIIAGKKGRTYMAFGSFWDGLKMFELQKNLLLPKGSAEDMITVASRKQGSSAINPAAIDNNPVDAGGNAIEAPFIFKKGKYFYLFASIDYCCKGEKSTYKMIVGRARRVTGPYLDKEGRELSRGGGTILLQGDKNWHGVGHNSVYAFDGKDYIVYHGYDAADRGQSKLNIKPLSWDENQWPVVVE